MSVAVVLEHRDRTLTVANKRLDSLVVFACAVARERKIDARLDVVLDRLAGDNEDNRWAWDGFNLERVFAPEDRSFFAGVFAEVAQRVFRRELGNHDVQGWQASLIADTYWISRALADLK